MGKEFIMDKKERQLIDYYYKKLVIKSFDEKDLYTFLKVVEPYSEENEVVHEISHFIFKREQNTGYAQAFLKECQGIIQEIGKTKVRKKIQYLYTFKEIRNGFNQLIQQLGYEKLSNDIMNDIQLCIISLLQHVQIISPETNKKIGHLSFAASSKELFLMGNIQVMHQGKRMPITFPVLAVQNVYEDVKAQDEKDTPYLFDDHLIEAVNIDHQLVITFPDM